MDMDTMLTIYPLPGAGMPAIAFDGGLVLAVLLLAALLACMVVLAAHAERPRARRGSRRPAWPAGPARALPRPS